MSLLGLPWVQQRPVRTYTLYMGTKTALVAVVGGIVGAVVALAVVLRMEGPEEPAMLTPLIQEVSVSPANTAVRPAPFDFRAAARRVMPSVVSIESLAQTFFGQGLAPTGQGSGVIISPEGYILTNAHVIAGARAVRVNFIDGRTTEAAVVGSDPRSDLAVIKVEGSGFPAVTIGNSDRLEVGEWVMAVGNPLGFSNTVSVGVVSNVGRTLPTEASLLVDVIQTDAAVNPGNSGGALTNSEGELVGINTAIASRTGESIGIGFAIPINRAQRIVEDIRRYGRVRYGLMGLTYDGRSGLLGIRRARQELQELAGSPTPPPSQGLLVTRVVPGTPAAEAGIRPFDVLTKLEGRPLTEPVDFMRVMLDKRPGERVTLEVWSRGELRTVTLNLVDIEG